MKRTLAFLLAIFLVLALTGCFGLPQSSVKDALDQRDGIAKDLEDEFGDVDTDESAETTGDNDYYIFPDTPNLPESWLQYPGSIAVMHATYDYEIDYRNMKVASESWALIAPEDVPTGQDGWNKVVEYYDGLAEHRADFEKDSSDGTYIWGDYNISLDGDTSQQDENRFEIWFFIELVEPIDPSLPIS